MTSEIIEDNEIKNGYLMMNPNNEITLDNIQQLKSNTNFIKIKLDEIDGPSNFPIDKDNSKRVSKKNKDFDDYIDYSPKSKKRQDSVGIFTYSIRFEK
jgi:hypothetical protein